MSREPLAHDPYVVEPVGVRYWWLLPLFGLVFVRFSPALALLVAAVLFGLGFVGKVLARHEYSSGPGSVAIPESARAEWGEIERLAAQILAAWPALGALADPADIGPEIARARYRLAGLLHRRGELDRAHDELRAAASLVSDASLGSDASDASPGSDASRVSDASLVLQERRAELTAEIDRGVAALRRLAATSGEHADRVRRAEQARDAVRRAERVAARPDPVEPDGLDDLAERTAAALEAYRELSSPPPPPPSPSSGAGDAGGGTV